MDNPNLLKKEKMYPLSSTYALCNSTHVSGCLFRVSNSTRKTSSAACPWATAQPEEALKSIQGIVYLSIRCICGRAGMVRLVGSGCLYSTWILYSAQVLKCEELGFFPNFLLIGVAGILVSCLHRSKVYIIDNSRKSLLSEDKSS